MLPADADDYEIDFNIIENIYQKSIDLFELKKRYNNKREKMELLKWRDKRRSNPNNIVQRGGYALFLLIAV